MLESKTYTKKQIVNIALDVLDSFTECIEFPIKVLEIANKMGLKVFKATFDRDDVSGMLKAQEGEIYISEKDNINRQRFSIAHEIGHYVLHYKGKVFEERDNRKHISYRDSLSSLGFSIKEIEANFFAANLLMPEDKVKELCRKGYSINQMADFFGVSSTGISSRLDFLGIEYE